MGTRQLPCSHHHDDEGRLRVIVPVASWDDYVHLAFDEIRHYGGGSIQVARRLLSALDDLLTVVPTPRRTALELQRQLVLASISREFPDWKDRVIAERADAQGQG